MYKEHGGARPPHPPAPVQLRCRDDFQGSNFSRFSPIWLIILGQLLLILNSNILLGGLDRAQHEIFKDIDLIFDDEVIRQSYVGIPISEQVDVFRNRVYSIGMLFISNIFL